MAIDSGEIQTEIQVVDFAAFLDGSAKQRAAEQILNSFKATGFVYLTNFGMSDEEVTQMFEWVSSGCSYFMALTTRCPVKTVLLAPSRNEAVSSTSPVRNPSSWLATHLALGGA